MIKARFVKASPTQDGITYVLQGQKDKADLHAAVDLQDVECSISQAEETDPTLDSLDSIVQQIMGLATKLQRYAGKETGNE